MIRLAAAASCVALAAAPALAACPIERATYGDRDAVAHVEFQSNRGAATVTNSFRMFLDNDVALDGIVQWTQDVARPNGKLMHNCPEGDVTGPEYEICTVWEGVIYSADEKGTIDLLPVEGGTAPKTLIFPDLGFALRASATYESAGLSRVPWDVFTLGRCQ